MIKYDFKTFMDIDGINDYNLYIHKIKERLKKEEGPDKFINIDKCITDKEIDKIIRVSKFIKNNCDVFLVIGVGGSYMGSKAIVSLFENKLKKDIEIIYTGYSFDSNNLANILEYIKNGVFPNNSPNSYINAYTIVTNMADVGDEKSKDLFE